MSDNKEFSNLVLQDQMMFVRERMKDCDPEVYPMYTSILNTLDIYARITSHRYFYIDEVEQARLDEFYDKYIRQRNCGTLSVKFTPTGIAESVHAIAESNGYSVEEDITNYENW